MTFASSKLQKAQALMHKIDRLNKASAELLEWNYNGPPRPVPADALLLLDRQQLNNALISMLVDKRMELEEEIRELGVDPDR